MVAVRGSLCYAVGVKMARGACCDKEERKMRRWVWKVLLAVAVMAALTVGASAADGDTVTLDSGIVLTQTGSNWTITGYTGTDERVVLPSKYGTGATDNITAVGPEAFKGKRITEVIVPSSITNIGPSAFEGCASLKTVVFFDRTGPAVIGTRAFLGCTGMTDLIMSKGITEIGEEAFGGCLSLEEVVIPDGVTALGNGAFNQCRKLTAVYIPKSLKGIDDIAFSNTPSLRTIHFDGSQKECLAAFATGHLPNNLNSHENYHAAKYDRIISTTDCDSPVNVFGGASCRSMNMDDVCKNLGKDIELEKLGHDYQEPLDKFAAEAAKHAKCETWTWTYNATCSRCGEELTGLTKTIEATEDHDMELVPDSEEITDATCIEDGNRTWIEKCKNCGIEEEKEETIPADGVHDYLTFDKLADQAEYFQKTPLKSMTCQEDGLDGYRRLCTVCKQLEPCAVCDGDGEIPADHWTTADPQTHHTVTITKDPDAYHDQHINDAEVIEIVSEELDVKDCDTGGKKTTTYRCKLCDDEFKVIQDIPGGTHVPNNPETVKIEATCQQEGRLHRDAVVCTVCGTQIEPAVNEVIPKTKHKWVNPVEVEKDPDGNDVVNTKATCGTDGVSHVIVTCEICKTEEYQVITLPATGAHTWGDWKLSADGKTETRTCANCTATDSRPVSPTEDPDKPDDPSDPDKPTTKPEDAVFKINLVQASNGTFSASKSTAKKGETVTVTYTPDSGYVLDMIRVISSSSVVSYTDLGGGRFQFTMPASDVEVRVTFDRADADYSGNWGTGFGNDDSSGGRSDPRRTTDIVPGQIEGHSVARADAYEQIFQDVPTGHWAAGEINWASGMGYMGGSGGRFNPDGLITHQQMWMVLARLTGASPANMAEARSWAVRRGYADGSSPTGAVKRHQLVTALYRCAGLTDGVSRANVTLSGYPDSRAVPARARVPFAWALTSGVVNADANGLLNPAKNVTRAEFAVILYCYSQRF